MEKLFYTDRYLREFTAEVVQVREKEGNYHVVLDKTAFFPGGGGQWADKGAIEKNEVQEVYEEDGIIFHVLKNKLLKIHRVKCEINWEHRLEGMQQHLAQHVLSGCFYQLFNRNTVSFHMGISTSTVDIEGILELDKITEAEAMANKIIEQSIDVELLTPSKSELRKLKLRRTLPKTNEQITVVQIGDLDINACCGVHPKNTLDLGAIKIIGLEKHKGNTRIEFVAGRRASSDYFRKDQFVTNIKKILNCGENEVINIIDKLTQQLKDSQSEHRELKNKLSQYEIAEMIDSGKIVKDTTIVSKIYDGGDIKHIARVAEEISKKTKAVILFAIKYEDRVNLIFNCSKVDIKISMNSLLKDAISLIDGKGGGNDFMAQGSGKNSSNLDSTLQYAIMKLENDLK